MGEVSWAALQPTEERFNPLELQRYKTLQDGIRALEAEQVVAKLNSSAAEVQQLSASLAAEMQQLQRSIEAENEESAHLDKYTNHYGCQTFFFGQRRRQEKIAQHTELLKKYEAQHAARAQGVAEVQKSLARARQEQGTWQGKVSQLQGLQAESCSLLDAMFSRPPWPSNPVLGSLVSQAASLRSQAASAQQTAGIYCTARGELNSSLDLCNRAASLLQQAGWLGHFEMGMDFGAAIMDPRFGLERRGGFGEFVQLMEIQQAQEMIREAAQQIMRARSILPSMPFIEEAYVHGCMTGIFADILVGNFMSEMIIVQQVHASMARVGQMMQEVNQCSNWCAQNESAFNGQHGSLAAAEAAKEAEVLSFKQQQVQAALVSEGIC